MGERAVTGRIIDTFAGPGGCQICGNEMPRVSRGVTCSPSCSARLRESRKSTEWRKPREYPSDLVERVRSLYESGLTVEEVQREIGRGVKVKLVMERYGIPRRKAAKRDQSRDRNLMWIGDAASYSAVHTRMGSASTHACVDCGESAEEWAYNGGCPRELICPRRQLRYSPDPERYSPRCKSCHLAQDRVRDEKGRLASKGGDAQ